MNSEQERFDAMMKMLAEQIQSRPQPLCLIRAVVSDDCVIEIRSTRYPTPGEWETVAQHLEVARAQQAARKVERLALKSRDRIRKRGKR